MTDYVDAMFRLLSSRQCYLQKPHKKKTSSPMLTVTQKGQKFAKFTTTKATIEVTLTWYNFLLSISSVLAFIVTLWVLHFVDPSEHPYRLFMHSILDNKAESNNLQANFMFANSMLGNIMSCLAVDLLRREWFNFLIISAVLTRR